MKEKSETKDLAMTPKEQDYTIENDVKSGSNSCARPDFKH